MEGTGTGQDLYDGSVACFSWRIAAMAQRGRHSVMAVGCDGGGTACSAGEVPLAEDRRDGGGGSEVPRPSYGTTIMVHYASKYVRLTTSVGTCVARHRYDLAGVWLALMCVLIMHLS